MIVADNGSDWYFSGGSDPRWDDDEPQPAQGDPRLGIRGRALGGPTPPAERRAARRYDLVQSQTGSPRAPTLAGCFSAAGDRGARRSRCGRRRSPPRLRGSARIRRWAPTLRRVPGRPRRLPRPHRSLADQRAWNQDVSQAPLDPRLELDHRLHQRARRQLPAPRLRLERASMAFPYSVVGQNAARVPVQLRHLRRRVRPRRLPDPAQRAGRGRRELRAATATCSPTTGTRCLLYELDRAFPDRSSSAGRPTAA